MIKLVNIDLSKVNLTTQIFKAIEEQKELYGAVGGYICKEDTKEHVIEEYWDSMQSLIGVLQKVEISAEEVMEHYPKHLEKLKNRPRD